MTRRDGQWMMLLVGALVIAVIASLWTGPAATTSVIFWQLRLPRVIVGVLVGMALATSGVIYQGILGNPLADPYILGTSSGASLGILLAALAHWRSPIVLYALALIFSLAAIMVVYEIARVDDRAPVQTLILAGVVVSTFLNALVALGFSLFFRESFSMLFFFLGTLAQYDLTLVKLSGVLIVVSMAVAWWYAPDLNVLSQGEDTARYLGIDPEKTKRVLFLSASMLVAASVAISGMIGFVGLIVPHCVRLITGPDHRRLFPASALAGALMLVILDSLSRTLAAPREIPVGVLAALCGTPFFIYLLRRKKGEMF